MGLFAAVTGLFKRSSLAEEDQVSVIQDVVANATTSSTTVVTPSNFPNTSTTASTSVGEVTINTVDVSMEEACPCGGSCTCKEEPEQEVVDSSIYDFHSEAPPTTQVILPGMDDIPAPINQESIPTVYKIEDASTLRPRSLEKVKQPKLPGFEDDPVASPKAKKKSNNRKASAKLTRKSTAKRKK